MGNEMSKHAGRCLCGAVRFEASGAPLWVAHCHCESCRRQTGSAMATFVGFAKDGFTYVAGAPATYHSSPGVTRGFCRRCGTPLTYEAERYPNEVHVYVCTLEQPEAYPPRGHVHVGEQLPWLQVADELPRHHTTSRDG